MSELFKEIQEDIHNERVERLWHNFGKMMIRASIAILAGTVVAVGWNSHQKSVASEHTALLMQGIDRIDIEDYQNAISTLDDIGGKDTSYARMAMLQKARVKRGLGDYDGVKNIYRDLAKQDASDAFVSLARLLAAEDTDTPLNVADDAPFLHLLKERRAWQLVAAGNEKEAVKEFSALYQDAKAPVTLRARAGEALASLSSAETGTKASAQ